MSATIAQLVRAYVKERRTLGDLAPSTIPNVQWTLLSFADYLFGVPPREISSAHVEKWLTSMSVARSTARNRFSHVRVFCQWLVHRGYLAGDPTVHLKSPRQPRPVPRGLATEDVRDLIGHLPDSRSRFIVVWMVQLGLRAVELTRLELGDIDFNDRSVLIRGKGGWQRLLPVTNEAWSVLVTYLVEHPARAGLVLRSYSEPWKGIKPATVVRLVSKWMGQLGTGHALRHSTATHLLRGQGVDVRDVQAVLGHQSLTSTSVYLPHSDLSRLRKILEGRRYIA